MARRVTHQGPRTHWPISEWEFYEIQRRMRDARALPRGRGLRAAVVRSIAADYGVSTRTVNRWAHVKVKAVRVGQYEALFCVNGQLTPAQVTPWEKVA